MLGAAGSGWRFGSVGLMMRVVGAEDSVCARVVGSLAEDRVALYV